MKRFTFFLLVVILSSTYLFSQPWLPYLSQKKSSDYSFFDYEKAFNSFCKDYQKHNKIRKTEKEGEGEYEGYGIPEYGQFKRWEWYWKYRVDWKTGAFPKSSSQEIFDNWKKKKYAIKSTIQGNWQSLGPGNVNSDAVGTGRVNCITFDPNDKNHFWVGAPAGGVWETTDGGNSWTVLTDNNPVLGVSDILLPSDYNKTTNPTIYIATGDRDGGSLWGVNGGQRHDNESVGVLKSTDGGASWKETGLKFAISDHATVGRLLGDPSNPNIIWAATNYGIYKTTDGGTSWTLKQADKFIDIEMKPDDHNILYASTSVFGVPYPRIYRSTDGGETWAVVKQFTIDQYRVDLTVSADAPNDVYAVVSMTDYNNSYKEYGSLYGIYKSTDAGASFSEIYDGTASNHNLCGWETDGSDVGGQGDYDLAFVANPSNANELYFGGVNGFKSTNGATSWTAVSCWTTSTFYNHDNAALVHADHHMMKYRSDGALFDVNDGGVYYTTDGGNSWNNITPGLVNGQLYGIGVAQDVTDEIVGGFQDNGTKRTTNASTWDDVKGGDGMHCAIDLSDHRNQYGTYAQGQIDHTTNDWGSSSSIRDGGSADWAAPLQTDPAGGDILYFGDEYVKKYNGSWTTLSKSLTNASSSNKYLTALDVYHNGSDLYIYAAGNDGNSWKIWKSPNGGGSNSTYTNITGNLPGNAITDIEVDYNDPNHIWVTLGGYDTNRVYETTDGGTNWKNISDGLPQIPAMTIIQNKDNTSEDELYVGMDVGVYVKQGNSPWVLFSNGLPNVVVSDLEFYYGNAGSSDDKILAATFGRGVWRSDPYQCPSVDAAIVDIISPVDNYCDLNDNPITPKVKLSNIGTTTLTSCDISYIIDGASAVNYHWTGNLSKGESSIVDLPTFNNTYGAHSITVTVSNPNGTTDDNSSNDSKTKTFDVWNNSLNYTQNFDNFHLDIGYEGTSVPLQECWTNDPSDSQEDWSVNTGQTSSSSTGPNGDHTSGNGKYLYTETSGISGAVNANLLSPIFDLTNYVNCNISFWYNMYGTAQGTMKVDLYYNGAWHNDIPVSWNGASAASGGVSGNQGQNWLKANANISAADGYSDVQIRIHATTGTSAQGDMAFDDFSISGDPAIQTITWTGNTNTDWQTSSNWNPQQIPTSSDNVDIPSSLTNYPVIDDGIAKIAQCNDLTIETGASLTINPGGYMTVAGSITNNAGNSGLIINSNASATGSLIQNSNSGVEATVNRYLDANTKAWHMLGSPVAAASITSVFPTTANLYTYDESTDDFWLSDTYGNNSTSGWTKAVSGNMTIGKGYLFNYKPTTLTFTGKLNTSDAGASIPIAYTDHTSSGVADQATYNYDDMDGWNLISNPFTSAIDWSKVDASAANLYDAIYVWDAANATYKSYVNGTDSYDGASTNGGSQYIPAMQGFFVKGNKSLGVGGTLNIPANARIHNSQSFWKKSTKIQNDFLRVKISNSKYSDETVIRFSNIATFGMDNKIDAYKLFSYIDSAPQIYTYSVSGNTEYSINTLPILNQTIIIPLKILVKDSLYSLSFPQLNFKNYFVSLKDKYGSLYKLTQGKHLNFVRNLKENTDRFSLYFVPKLSQINEHNLNVLLYPNPNNGIFKLIIPNNGKNYRLRISNSSGQIVYMAWTNAPEMNINLKKFGSGIYFSKIILINGQVFENKIIIK
jgi:photosystem II stability/assembly factor-like uncharacterized protein